jgi:hypothetical protein
LLSLGTREGSATFLERTPTAQLDRRQDSDMQGGGMLIDHGSRLRAPVADRVVEVERGDAMFAKGAGEGGIAVRRFGCVVSHALIVTLSARRD